MMKSDWANALKWYREDDTKSRPLRQTGVISIIEFILLSPLQDSLCWNISHGVLLIRRRTSVEGRESARTLKLWNIGSAQSSEICLEEKWQENHTTFIRIESVQCRNDDALSYFQDYLCRL